MEKRLEMGLDLGLTELQFWEMTIGEYDRFVASQVRIQKQKKQERAFFDYRLADLIGYSMARLYSKDASYPEIYDVYPAIFDREAIEEAKQKEKNKQTAEWLKNFAESFKKSKTKEGKDQE